MRPLRVVLADGGLLSRRDVLALAERAGFDLVGEAPEWPSVAELVDSKAADLVLVNGDAEFARGVRALRCGSLVLAPDAVAAKEYVETGAYAVLSLECEPEVVAAMGQIALARASDLQSAHAETDGLRQQLETRKLVERAKGVLMKRLGVSEDQAYRRMQKASQDENRKLRDVADSILAAERLYGDPQPKPAAAAPPKAPPPVAAESPKPVASEQPRLAPEPVAPAEPAR
jgi:response regulator NasT